MAWHGVCSPDEGVLEGDNNGCRTTLNTLKATLLGAQGSSYVVHHLWCRVSLSGSHWQLGYQRPRPLSCHGEETGFCSLVQETGIFKLMNNKMVSFVNYQREEHDRQGSSLGPQGQLPILTLSSCSPSTGDAHSQETVSDTVSSPAPWKPPSSGQPVSVKCAVLLPEHQPHAGS